MWIVGIGASLGAYFFSGILTHVPGVATYARFVKPVAGILALLCTFMYGGAGVQAMWEEKIRVAEEQRQVAEAKAAQLNTDLTAERKKKEGVRIEYRDRVKTEIRQVAVQIDSKCDVDPIVIDKLNKSAKNPEGAK
jgi:2-hydroxychromene-2-carboxylate isomerase